MNERDAIEQYAYLARAEALRRYRQFGMEREDAEQEAMIGLLNAIRTYDPNRGALEGYLRMKCRYHLRTVFRNNTRLCRKPPDYLLALDDNNMPVCDSEILDFEALRRVATHILALKPQERIALLMAAYGYPNREIAKVIKRPAVQISYIRTRAAKKVREAMSA